ncbi:MAG: hypothetical protein IJV14_10880 [Lachnospiraceae bacterium]|nr:hypothetical protein [Lachnospiraceae bacterium]
MTPPDIEYENGYKAKFTSNILKKNSKVSLYTPDGRFASSIILNTEAPPTLMVKAAADGLLHGYFSGWADCRAKIRGELSDMIARAQF